MRSTFLQILVSNFFVLHPYSGSGTQGPAGRLGQKHGTVWVLFSALGRTDPAGALQFIETMPEGVERNQHTARVLNGWTVPEPQAAIAWVLALKDEKARMEHLEGLTRSGFQGQHSQPAWDTVVKNVTDPTQRKNRLGSMVMSAGQSDHADTLRRIQVIPPGEQTALLRPPGEMTPCTVDEGSAKPSPEGPAWKASRFTGGAGHRGGAFPSRRGGHRSG